MNEICDAIVQPSGEQLLRFLRAVYRGDPDDEWIHAPPQNVADLATDLGLVTSHGTGLALTPPGYLVGNVAKEYCNWIDQGRCLPTPRPSTDLIVDKDVVDLGCSFGRWLWDFQTVARSAVGIEMQQEYIELGKALAMHEGIPVPDMRRGSAEEVDLHVPRNSVDLVFSRLMFNHVAIKKTLRKVADVLRPGGVLWLQVEPFSTAVRKVFQQDKRLRSRAFAMFAVCNSILLMATGKQLHLRAPGRMHATHKPAYPSLRWWKAALDAVGLKDFRAEHASRGLLVFWARKH